MICHLSLPAKDPARAAEAIARIIDGESMKYPVVRGAYIVVANDGSGTAIETWPETTTQSPGSGLKITDKSPDYDKWDGLRTWDYQLKYDSKPSSEFPIHIAVSTKLSVEELLALGEEFGWRVVSTDRVAFNLVEFWLENQVLIECIPENTELDRYRDFSKPAIAREAFAMMPEH